MLSYCRWAWDVMAGHYQPLALVGVSSFLSCLALRWVLQAGYWSCVLWACPLGGPFEGLASLLWLWCALRAIISQLSIALSKFMLIWIPIVLLGIHASFTLMNLCSISTQFALLFWGIIFLEYESGLWAIEHYHITIVAVLFQDYKIPATLCCWALGRDTSDVFTLGFSVFGT